MRTALVGLVILGTGVHAVAAPPLRPLSWSHIRPLTASSAKLVTDAAARSPIVSALLDSLEQTDVFVYVKDCIDEVSHPRAFVRFVAYTPGRRYLLIQIDRWRVMPNQCTAWLAHELQHALEVASAPEVTDAASLARLYRRIGYESGPGQFETDLAQAVGRRVFDELAGLVPRR